MADLSKCGCTALLVTAALFLSGCDDPPQAQAGSSLNIFLLVRTHPINLTPGAPGSPPPLPSEQELEQLCESMKNTVWFRVQSTEPGSSPIFIFSNNMTVQSISDDENQADCRYYGGITPGDGEYEVTANVDDSTVHGLGSWITSCNVIMGGLPKSGAVNETNFRMDAFAGPDQHQGCCINNTDENQLFPPVC